MADVSVGDRDELHVMSRRGPLGGDAGGFEFGIVGMCAETDDPQLAVGRARGRQA